MSIVERLTKDCARADCSLSSQGSVSTCIGWTPMYDRNGRLTNRNQNITRTIWGCLTCGRSWEVKAQYGETTITEDP